MSATVVLPAPDVGPVRAVLQRVLIALGVLLAVATIVWLDGDSYKNATRAAHLHRRALLRDRLALHDRLRRHHAGDPVGPAGQHPRHHAAARAVPHRPGRHDARGPHERTREHIRQNRWRSTCETTPSRRYGTKGRSAFRALLEHGADSSTIVASTTTPTTSPTPVTTASRRSSRRHARRRLLPGRRESAARVVVAVPRDDAACS
jgi:voltage-gated potassium channel